MTDCLAATGGGLSPMVLIVGAILLLAGGLALAIALRRRAALFVLLAPLALGIALFGASATPAEAACPPAAAPTPTPTQTLEPTGDCAVDDVFDLEPEAPFGGVDAPGVLANDIVAEGCEGVTVVSNTDAVETAGSFIGWSDVDVDGSFDYEVEEPATSFTFDYTLSDGSTATVVVNHDYEFSEEP